PTSTLFPYTTLFRSELQHLHTRKARSTEQCAHFVRYQPEVFGDHRRVAAECRANGVEHRVAGSAHPIAAHGGRRVSRHLPGSLEATKMVDANEVDQLQKVAEPVDPPSVPIVSHRAPVVERVTPQLACGAEIVWR